jgi:hypothetical protein
VTDFVPPKKRGRPKGSKNKAKSDPKAFTARVRRHGTVSVAMIKRYGYDKFLLKPQFRPDHEQKLRKAYDSAVANSTAYFAEKMIYKQFFSLEARAALLGVVTMWREGNIKDLINFIHNSINHNGKYATRFLNAFHDMTRAELGHLKKRLPDRVEDMHALEKLTKYEIDDIARRRRERLKARRLARKNAKQAQGSPETLKNSPPEGGLGNL